MNWSYAYNPTIWPSFGTGVLLLALAAFSWRRRNVPGALLFFINCLLTFLVVTGKVMAYLAANDLTRTFWNRYENIWYIPCATAVTCFILEYAWPRRWLTRRNLILLSIAPLLGTLYLLTDNFFNLFSPDIRVGGVVGSSFGQMGGFLFIYSLLLTAINFAVFAWLFIRSPQHRWPVILMAIGQILTRILLLRSSPELDARLLYIPVFVFAYLAYAIALFGFRIFDPVPMARQTAIDQLQAGMLVLDHQGRVTSLNPSAERILQIPASRARAKQVREVLPVCSDDLLANPEGTEIEFSLGTGKKQRWYLMTNSKLNDFRGLEVGRLLMLRDITEQKQAHAQLVEQQRALAMLQEREQLARELHDGLGQAFAFVNTQGQAVRRLLMRGDIATADAYVGRMVEVAREADRDIRESILGLRVTLSEQGLFPTLDRYLDQYEKNYSIRTQLEKPAACVDGAFDPLVEVQLLRILQEALTNVRKHANAGCVRIAFTVEDDFATVTVQDDGLGFDSATRSDSSGEHVGLRVMRERAREVGGRINLHSEPGQGTVVVVRVPVKNTGMEGVKNG